MCVSLSFSHCVLLFVLCAHPGLSHIFICGICHSTTIARKEFGTSASTESQLLKVFRIYLLIACQKQAFT